MEKRFFKGQLARKFALLAVLIALPLWATSVYLLVLSLDAMSRFSHREVQGLAHLVSTHVDAWLQDEFQDLEMLASLPAVRSGRTLEAYQALKRSAGLRPAWHGLMLVAPDGRLLIHTGRPFTSPLPTHATASSVQKTLQDRRPHISDVYETRVDRIAGVTLAVPVLEGRTLLGALAVVYRADALQDVFSGFQVFYDGSRGGALGLPGAVITLLDAKGVVTYRSVDSTHWIGQVEARMVERVKAAGVPSGTMVVEGPDEVERLYGFESVGSTGWYVLVGVPLEALSVERSRLLPPSLLLALVSTLATLVLVILMARRYTEPMLALRDAAIAFGRGDMGARVTQLPADEVGELGTAFNRMADQIQRSKEGLERMIQERTAQVEAANEELESSNAQLVLVNRQLSATIDDLRRLDQQRGEFLNMVSHDLRIPLTAILGYAELLQEGTAGALNPRQQDYVEGMMASIDRMTTLLEQLLDYARIEARQLKLDRQAFNLGEVIPEALEPLMVLAQQKGQQLRARMPSDLPLVEADPIRILQVLSNLVSNAIKYTPDGGEIEVKAEARDGRVRVSVGDNGIGIPLEDQPRLFQRFYRATNVGGLPGTGLGLSLAKGIIEAHGGAIGFESTPGRGSTFWFDLPASRAVE